jgi:hypothetical protein
MVTSTYGVTVTLGPQPPAVSSPTIGRPVVLVLESPRTNMCHQVNVRILNVRRRPFCASFSFTAPSILERTEGSRCKGENDSGNTQNSFHDRPPLTTCFFRSP